MAQQFTLFERNAMVHLNHYDYTIRDDNIVYDRFKCRLCMKGLLGCLCFNELKHCPPCQQCFRLTYTGTNGRIRQSLGYNISPDKVVDLTADQDVDEVDGRCCGYCRKFNTNCVCMEFVTDGNKCYGCYRATLPMEPIRKGYVPRELLLSFGYGAYIFMDDKVLLYSDTSLSLDSPQQTITRPTCSTCGQNLPY